jgi:arachidonate 15-lipoxygenase
VLSLKNPLLTDEGYIADYEDFSFVQGGTNKGRHKYLPKPLAFFHWKKNPGLAQGELVPLAIQIHQKPGGSIYTSRDNPMDWLVAKLCVQIADGNHLEMSSHLCRTHFVMAPFAIATARKLAINHPLGLLLRPPLRFLLAVNDQGFQLLINPYVEGAYGGHVDRILAGTLQESLGILKNAYDSWDLGQFEIRTELEERGLDDASQLPHFPYRDDGLLVWDAIEKFVSNFLHYWYPDDANSTGNQKIRDDSELQDWARDLVEEGGVKGMPSPIETVEQLIKIVINVLFTSGPQHAAVNYSQYDYLAFVPNMPLAAYEKIPESKGEIPDEAALMKFLPPQEQADVQLKIINFLSFYRHDRLGYYDESFHMAFMGNPHIKLLVQQFQQDLYVIEQEIEMRNRSRYVPYPYLKPSLIPNGISA